MPALNLKGTRTMKLKPLLGMLLAGVDPGGIRINFGNQLEANRESAQRFWDALPNDHRRLVPDHTMFYRNHYMVSASASTLYHELKDMIMESLDEETAAFIAKPKSRLSADEDDAARFKPDTNQPKQKDTGNGTS